MPDFSALLSKPAGEAPRPKVIPAGAFPAVIKSKLLGESQKKKTPYVRFNLGLTGWPADMEESEQEGIDIQAKHLRVDYYLTEDSMYRLDECLVALGIDMQGKTYEEALEEAIGLPCTAIVTQDVVEGRDDPVNNVQKLLAAA